MNSLSLTLRNILFLLLALSLTLGSELTAQETDKDMPVGAVGGAVHADPFTGTATTSIPIEVPPGRQGVQPDLALVYGSSNGNGWLGMGWKLEKGVIDRQTKFGVNYSGDDYVFRLSGINVELVNIGNDEYRAKVEGGFTRVKKLTATDGKPYFEATDKMGKKFIFGRAPEARVFNGNRIFRWCLERVEDVHGNYMTITYTADQGQAYLDTIYYTGNANTGLPTTNTVKFYLENRPDASPMYVPNFKMTTGKRLRTIEVMVNNNIIRAYKLEYSLSQGTGRSTLKSVKQYGSNAALNISGDIVNGTSLPPVSLTSSEAENSFASPTVWLNGSGTYNQGYQFPGDFNGDGKQDWMYLNGSWKVALSNGQGFNSPTTWLSGSGTYNLGHQYVADFNGDGKDDWMYLNGSWYVALSNGQGFNSPVKWLNGSGPGGATYHQGFQYLGDYNGDGKQDYMYWRDAWYVALSNGNGFNTPIAWFTGQGPSGWPYNAPAYQYVGDFNGDGKHDWMYLNGDWYVMLSTGSSFQYPSKWLSGSGTYNPGHQYVSDFNGDGKQDWMYLNGSWYVALSNGQGFNTPTAWLSGSGTYNLDYQFPGDFNGDGKTDWLYLNGSWKVALSNGQGFNSPTTWLSGSGTYNFGHQFPGDFNGDGKSDWMYLNGNWHVAKRDGTNDLLENITNGLGATTTIHYVPSTQYSNTQLPYPIQTVNFLKTNDGNGNEAVTYYAYNGGFHHIAERDFRGFNYVKVTGQAGPSGEQSITETWFHQGNDTAVDSNNPNVPDGYLKGAPYRVKVTDGSGNLYTETTTTYTAPNDPNQAPFFSPPSSVVTDICDGNGCSKQTRTDYTYDLHGNVTREDQYGDTGTDSDDRTVIRTYSPNTTDWTLSLPTSETIYEGLGTSGQLAHTDFYYDGTSSCSTPSTNQQPTKGQLTRVVKWLNSGPDPETRMAYDSYGNAICSRDAKGNETTMAYDSSGTFATSVTNALGHVTSTQYYGVNGLAMDTGLYGQVKTVTDPNGAVATKEYDALGRRTNVTQPDGFRTTTSYNSFGTAGSQHVRTDTTVEGTTLSTWIYFDGLGRTITSKSTGTDSKIIMSQTEYDARGAVSRSSTPYFETGGSPLWSTSTYDPMGRVIRTNNPDGSRGLACFDEWVTVTIDANNHRKRTTRDGFGRIATVQEYTGTFTSCDTSEGSPYSTTTYHYDDLGNLLTLTDTLGNQSTMSYDTLSRKISMQDPDMGNWTYEYDVNGNLTKQTDAKNQQIHFQYDVLNRRVQKDFTTQKSLGNGDVVYTYDGNSNNRKGRLQKVQDSSGTTAFYYDITGRVIKTDKVVDSATYTTQSAYDGLGRVTQLTYPDTSTVTQTYNGPQLKEVKEGSTTYASYGGFNALGQPSTLTLGNGITTTYTYDAQNFRLKTLTTLKGSTTLQDLGYTFDEGGNVIGLTDSKHGNQTFGYDDLDRLTSASGAYPTITYAYNQIGNMTSKSQVGTYLYPASGRSSVRPHAVTDAGATTYTYDANGNMISGAGRTMAYDHENRPITITANGKTTTLLYDGDGGRVKKTVNDGNQVKETTYIGKLYVCDGTAAPLSCAKMIFAGSQRIAMVQPSPPIGTGSIDYFHPDHLGSTRVLTNNNGVSEQNLAYYPYGNTRVNTGESGSAVEEWKLDVGTFAGGNDLYQSSGLGQQTSVTVPNLPTDGSQVYVSLSYKVGGQWDHDDYVYTASTGEPPTPTANPISINFQPNGATVPNGYLKDDGSTYNSALGYGWTTSVNTRERNALIDQTHDTLIHFDAGTTVDWNYDLPNGDYLVSLVSGDPSYPQGPHTIAVEGTTVINGVTTQANEFITITDHPVTITDGQLTLQLTRAGGSSKTIINSLLITPVSTTPPTNQTLTTTITGAGTVTSTPGGVNCANSSCNTAFPNGTSITLTATPSAGQSFSGWSGACSGTTPSCQLTLTTDQQVTAVFSTTPPADLVGHWTFDESSGTQAADHSGNTHHGTLLNGPSWTTGKAGGALDFDGNNDYLLIGDPADGSLDMGAGQDFTLAAWIKTSDRTPNAGDSLRIISKQVSGGRFYTLRERTEGTVGFEIRTDSGNYAGQLSTTTIDDGQWHHVAGTRQGGLLTIYVDGVAEGSTNGPTGTLANSAPLYIGHYQPGQGQNFHGTIDDVRIYQQALTASDIATLALATTDPILTTMVSGTGTVTSTPSGINCSNGSCTTSFETGTVVALTATPTGGQSFSGWSGACSGTNPSCQLTLTADQSVTATFAATPPPSTDPISINFQPSGAPVPTGYLKDDGSVYNSAHGYGWTTSVNTRDRNYLSDQTRDTLIHFDTGTTVDWNYDLANGNYLVSLVSGDPSFPQGPHTIAVEGTTVINGLNTQANEFITITDQPVTVTDGKLTLSLTRAGGSSKTMVNSLIITPVSTSASLAPKNPKIHVVTFHTAEYSKHSAHIHQAVSQETDRMASPSTIRQGGGIYSLRFVVPQLAHTPTNPLIHLVTHGGTPSTTMTPTPGNVLPGSTVTFSWSYAGESNSGTTNVPYRYTGKEQDDSTGLYYYEARYYDPFLGRFISADTIVPSATDPQALNRYSYARNNPIFYTDPSGHFFKSIKKSFKSVEKFAFKYRHYASLGSSIGLDYALTNRTVGLYVRIAGAAAASYWGGPWGAAGFAAYTTRLDGGSAGDAIKSGAITGGTSYAFQQSDLYLGDSIPGIAAHGAIGGTSAELQGGKFQNGFITAASAKTLNVLWNASREWTQRSSYHSGNRTSCRWGVCVSGTRPLAGGAAMPSATGAAEWGMSGEFVPGQPSVRADHWWNGIPLVDDFFEATGHVHDWVNGGLAGTYTSGGYFLPFGSGVANDTFNLLYNFPTMVPSAAVTAGAALSGNPVTVDISKKF